MAKSAEAFRTISEAAKELDVPQHVLRHWEEVFGQVRPMRRAGGRRYYRPLDLDLLRGIRSLLYDQRYTTKGVQKIFKDEGVRYVSELGRRAAAGEAVDVRPVLKEDEGAAPEAAVSGTSRLATENPFSKARASAAQEATAPGVESAAAGVVAAAGEQQLSPETERTLRALLNRLELVQEAIDEASLALEAIAPDEAEAPVTGAQLVSETAPVSETKPDTDAKVDSSAINDDQSVADDDQSDGIVA